jgi:glucosylceramidase
MLKVAARLDRRSFLGGMAMAWFAASRPLVAATQPVAAVRPGRWIVTTASAPWRLGPTPIRQTLSDPDGFDVEVLTDGPMQTIEGFGACFNEMGWDALQVLSASDRDAVFVELFGENGAGFNLCRMPVGANDFSRDWYSYDETADDFALQDFSVARDETSLIPFIRAAQRVRPDLQLWASPWSPPTWMKTNGHYASVANRRGWPANGLRPGQEGREGTDMFVQDNRYFEAYARYFGRFIDEYAARGIRIGMVMPQNEFNSAQPFPSCCWTPAGLARFLPHLDREMRKRGVEIFFGTFERADEELFERVYQEAAAGSAVKGIGVQWAGKGAVAALHRRHPTLRIYQTEQECGDGRNDWRYARYTWSLLKTYLQNGASAYHYWNIALLQKGVSRWGWAQNSLLTVDGANRRYRWNHEYWLMKHLAAYVKPGAQRFTATSWKGYEDVLAFRNRDGSIALIAHNPLSEPLTIRIKVSSEVIVTTLPADSFASLQVATAA